MLKTTIAVNLESFDVPNYILEASPMPTPPATVSSMARPVRTFQYSEIHPEVLSEMCDAFREQVFKKAGVFDPGKNKTRPVEPAPGQEPSPYPPAPSVASTAGKLITLVESERHLKGLTTVLNEASETGLISGFQNDEYGVTVVLTPTIKISFHK